MKKNLLPTLRTLAALLALAGLVRAHGGNYRGPGKTPPPQGGSPRGTPAPTARGSRGSSPAAPSPSRSSDQRTASRKKRGPTTISLTLPDYPPTDWRFWWKSNKDVYLRLKEILRKGNPPAPRGILPGLRNLRDLPPRRPSLRILKALVVPALERALREERRRDIVSACLVALAKIGLSRDLGSLLRPFLKNPDQEIAETAVLCHGIAGLVKAVPDLIEIMKDTPRGRILMDSIQGINFRKRAFAACALGLIAYAHEDLKLKRTVFQEAKEILDKSRFANRDIPVSAIIAVRLLNPDLSDPKGLELAVEASRYLLDFMKNRQNRFQMRAHVPTALSRLLGRSPGGPAGKAPGDGPAGHPGAKAQAIREEAIGLMKTYLKRHKENPMILQSCVLALGEMGDPKDEALIQLLEETSRGKTSRDLQVRFFANIALGYLGAAGAGKAVDDLALRLQKRGRKMDKPWIALGLGVSQAELLLRGKPTIPAVGQVLFMSFLETRNPNWKGAMAVALGLSRFTQAGPMVQAAMERSRIPVFKGYCAAALGLMNYKDALEDMRDMLPKSLNESDLLVQTALGLGLMGEKSLVPDLQKSLWKTPSNQDTQGALAQALGQVGDARCLPHLVDMLFDENLPARTRSFAAAALGILGDPRPLPWNAPIAFGLNYRAEVETLSGAGTGILDIL